MGGLIETHEPVSGKCGLLIVNKQEEIKTVVRKTVEVKSSSKHKLLKNKIYEQFSSK